MPASFTVHVDDLESVLQLYDRIQVWRATSSDPLGSYVEITDEQPAVAVLDSTVSGPFAVSGQALSIEINGADAIVVTFTGVNPIPLADILTQINLAFSGLATLTTDNHLRLKSPLPGTGSSIHAFGAAAATLGLATTIHYGKGARPRMGLLNTEYRFVDLSGDSSTYYKTRFSSSITNVVGTFSDPHRGDITEALSPPKLVKMTVNLVDLTGAPVVGRSIILTSVAQQTITDSGVLYGVLPSSSRIELLTDGNGHAEATLAIGLTLRAFFEGSGFSREFVVPNTDFDLLSVLSTQPDPFSIVQAPPMPIRES